MASAAPPPLKKRRRESAGDLELAPPGLDLSDIGDAVEESAADDDATEGEWVFKQDDVVLGPVSAAVLVQRVEKGELTGETPVGREAGKWRPLKAVPYFKEVLDKAEARRRAIAQQLAHEARRRRERLVRFSAMAALVALPFLVGAVGGRAVMVARPWDDTDDWLQRPPPLVDLPPKPKEQAPPPPRNAKAEGEGRDEPAAAESAREVVAKAEEPRQPKRSRGSATNKKRRSQKQAKASQKKPEAKKPEAKKAEPAAPKKQERISGTLSQAQVMGPVKKSQGAIGSCLKAEVARNEDMPPRVTLMWTVTEEGRATGFKLKERQVRDGPLPGCLRKVFAGMRWPKFQGERKNVELPLGVKK